MDLSLAAGLICDTNAGLFGTGWCRASIGSYCLALALLPRDEAPLLPEALDRSLTSAGDLGLFSKACGFMARPTNRNFGFLGSCFGGWSMVFWGASIMMVVKGWWW